MKQSKRVISAILIVFMIIGQLSNVFAATIGQTVDLVKSWRMWKTFKIQKFSWSRCRNHNTLYSV